MEEIEQRENKNQLRANISLTINDIDFRVAVDMMRIIHYLSMECFRRNVSRL